MRVQEEKKIAESKAFVDQAICTAVVVSTKSSFGHVPIILNEPRSFRQPSFTNH